MGIHYQSKLNAKILYFPHRQQKKTKIRTHSKVRIFTIFYVNYIWMGTFFSVFTEGLHSRYTI